MKNFLLTFDYKKFSFSFFQPNLSLNQLKLANFLLENPNKFTLKILNKAFQFLIPFNSPHGFNIEIIEQNNVKILLPYKRKNLNHVKGIHACAIATLGEFCAGILLLRNFGIEKYRFILSKLEIEYSFQGKTDLIGESSFNDNPGERKRIQNELGASKISYVTLISQIKDQTGRPIASIKSTWQIKDWENVKTKIQHRTACSKLGAFFIGNTESASFK